MSLEFTTIPISDVNCVQIMSPNMELAGRVLCRTCLTCEGDYIELDSKVTTLTGEQLKLLDCWQYCVQPIAGDSESEILPRYVCTLCSKMLQSTYEFMKRARESYAALQAQKPPAAEFMPEEEEGDDDDAVSVGVLELDAAEDQAETPANLNPASVEASDALLWANGSCDSTEFSYLLENPYQIHNMHLTEYDVENLIEDENELNSDIFRQSPNDSMNECSLFPKSQDLEDTTDFFSIYEDEVMCSDRKKTYTPLEVADKMEVTCAQCLREFRDYFRYEDHMYEHRGMHPYACEMCAQRLQTMKGIVQHYVKAHKTDPTLDMVQPKGAKAIPASEAICFEERDVYMCAKCSYENTSLSLITAHIRETHGTSSESCIIKKLPYECPRCLRSFSSEIKVRTHCEYEHNTLSHSSSVKQRKTAVCTKCGKRYEHCKMKTHEERCISQTSYQCKLCGGIFADRTSLMAHKSELHPPNPNLPAQGDFKCDTCGNTYRSRLQLRFHIKRHEARDFQCDQCNRTFIRLHDLNKHQIIHTGELPHKCDICEAPFRYMHSLAAHKERLHMNKSFKCRVEGCDAEFRTRSQLNDHKYKHIGNPYRCELCPKNFMRREHFRRHSKAVHNICLTEEALTKMYQQHMGRYNAHDIRKMSESVE